MTHYYRLKPQQLKSLSKGRHCDGQGLYFHARGEGRGQWEYRYKLYGTEHWTGLGGYPAISLKDARDRAKEAREMVANHDNPIKVKRKQRDLLNIENGSLRVLSAQTHETLRATLKKGDPTDKWSSPLRCHVLPKLGQTPILKIDAQDLAHCLKEVWGRAPETGRKALTCLRSVYRYAIAHGFDVDLGEIDKAEILLGPRKKSNKHIPGMHWKKVPAFYATMNDIEIDHLALRLLILTGLRTDPIRHLRLEQIDGTIWTVPAEHVKGREDNAKPFRLPLGPEALAVIELAKRHEWNGFLFPNSKGAALDRMALIKLMRGRKMVERPHGFRSSLRTWLSETTDASHEVMEACIGHFEANKVVKAYKRTDFFEKREPLMLGWENYVLSGKS